MVTEVYSYKNLNLRNYFVIRNEDAQDLLANNIFGRVKQINVEYVWFKVKNIQHFCTQNEYKYNFASISKYTNAVSSDIGTLNAESVDSRERFE
jgi:hypothetical protein